MFLKYFMSHEYRLSYWRISCLECIWLTDKDRERFSLIDFTQSPHSVGGEMTCGFFDAWVSLWRKWKEKHGIKLLKWKNKKNFMTLGKVSMQVPVLRSLFSQDISTLCQQFFFFSQIGLHTPLVWTALLQRINPASTILLYFQREPLLQLLEALLSVLGICSQIVCIHYNSHYIIILLNLSFWLMQQQIMHWLTHPFDPPLAPTCCFENSHIKVMIFGAL